MVIKRKTIFILNGLFYLIFIFFLDSCKKLDVKEADIQRQNLEQVSLFEAAISNSCDSTICEDCAFQEAIDEDTTEYPTILGNGYTNPYSIQVMTQAYNNVHGTNLQSIPTTHYYVRFKPTDSVDLNVLDSLDAELYDYPLDREVVQEGDYWPDAYTNLAPGEIPWLYTVVESGFHFPVGINHEVLASLNIPDDDPALEDEAFTLTGNSECDNGPMILARQANLNRSNQKTTSSQRQVKPYVQQCLEGYHWDYFLKRCVPNNCPDGYHWDDMEQQCMPDASPPPPSTNLHPQGMISFNVYDDYGIVPQLAPLKYIRIVGRRFMKIDKTYTDANGNFQFSKRFPRKVTIVVKLKLASDYGSHMIKQTVQALGIWKQLFPLKKNIGTYKGNNLQNLHYTFQRGRTPSNWKTRRWIGCIALNTVLETNSFLSANGLTTLNDNFKIYLQHPSVQDHPLLYQFIYDSYAPLTNIRGGWANKGLPDIVLQWPTSDINSLTTSKVTINVAQQLSIDYLYRLMSYDHFIEYGNAIDNDPLQRFNSGNPIIAVWQCVAQHLGHTVANRFFGSGEYNFVLQGKTWNSVFGISSSSSKYLEQFDPTISPPNEPYNWIPVGVINDLIDNISDPFPVIDNVSGFTYLEIETALRTDPATIADFKAALKSVKPAQSGAIDQLFASYGY